VPRPPFLRLLRPPPGDGVPDRDLALRYAETGDEAAFELLVRRHADAVWAAWREQREGYAGGGAILGDRVRMQDHATDPGVFIRSIATTFRDARMPAHRWRAWA